MVAENAPTAIVARMQGAAARPLPSANHKIKAFKNEETEGARNCALSAKATWRGHLTSARSAVRDAVLTLRGNFSPAAEFYCTFCVLAPLAPVGPATRRAAMHDNPAPRILIMT